MDHLSGQTAQVLSRRYELGPLLGRGGMSEVYRAYDRVMQRAVAVKVLRADLADETTARRMAIEAQILARLEHPHLVRVHDAGSDAGQCYIVMELVEGSTLYDMVRRGPLPPGQVAQLGSQLADALAAIHHAGFVHRDVKPANVLLTQQGGEHPGTSSLFARLTDFGIARIVDGTRLTSTGLLMGTAPYLSPEQVLGAHVGHPSDVYALGLLLLECLTGQQAYPGPAIESAVARLHRQPEVPQSLGLQWSAVLTGLTARDPSDRPTAVEAASQLRDLAEGRPPSVTSPMRGISPVPGALPGLVAVDGGELTPVGGLVSPVPRSGATAAVKPAAAPRRLPRRLVGALALAAALSAAAVLVSPGTSPFTDGPPAASAPANPTSGGSSTVSGSSTRASSTARTPTGAASAAPMTGSAINPVNTPSVRHSTAAANAPTSSTRTAAAKTNRPPATAGRTSTTAAHPTPSRVHTKQVKAAKPQAAKPQAAKPQAAKPKAAKPKAAKPKAAKPKAAKPKASKPQGGHHR